MSINENISGNSSRKLMLYLLLMLTILSKPVFAGGSADEVMDATRRYIESMEWDTNFYAYANKYSERDHIYISKLSSDSPEDVYLSSVMIGLLEIKEAIPKLKQVSPDTPLERIGIAFALCRLGENCPNNIEYLMAIGITPQKAGGAKSLKYLEAVELLSLLNVEHFIQYASNLKMITDEAYQREAIEVALIRYQAINK